MERRSRTGGRRRLAEIAIETWRRGGRQAGGRTGWKASACGAPGARASLGGKC